ncbi:sensor histidine kinase [Azospirillum soli]|uniref:sensor histidine kinase n=1 Tax=Azospirillum soli TaxID=1304799 RepID=UPI001AE8FB53|nr:HAMP domain-containing sensor histidine kinase [Azospirillum soli]MBP2313084.1 signal transduction histidine kinase [Azospirillum soli]
MRLPSFLVTPAQLRGEDVAAYRDKARHRDRIVLRVIAALIVSVQTSRLFFDLNLSPGFVQDGLAYRLFGIACLLALFAASFHRVTLAHLHAVVGVGFLMGTASLAKAYAEAHGQMSFANTTVGIALIVLGAFSFGPRLVALIGVTAVTITFVHMPLVGLDVMGLGPRLIGSGMVAATTLLGSWLLDQHWRRNFLTERALALSHENLRRAHRELADAHATLTETQAQLLKVERAAALGRLVAGLAHRINTPVGIQVSLASHLADTTERFSKTVADGGVRRSDLASYVDTVRDTGAIVLENARRIARLVETFKQLEGKQLEASAGASTRQGAAITDIGDLLARTRPLIEAMMPPGIALVVEAPLGLKVRGTRSLLETVLSQTVGNAVRHAFPDARAGTVTLRADRDADGGVVLTVADDGCGIRPEHLEHVFDPFYTDGTIGGGEGLGLSIVQNAVTGPLGGQIAIDSIATDSREGGGTTVTVRLPAAAPAPEDADARTAARPLMVD